MPKSEIHNQRGGNLIGLSYTPEDKTLPFWVSIYAVAAHKTATGNWPTKKDATYGKFLRTLCETLKHSLKRSELSPMLTPERMSYLRSIGFPRDGILPYDYSQRTREGPLDRIRKTLASGQQPAKADIMLLRKSTLSETTRQWLLKNDIRV